METTNIYKEVCYEKEDTDKRYEQINKSRDKRKYRLTKVHKYKVQKNKMKLR